MHVGYSPFDDDDDIANCERKQKCLFTLLLYLK